MTKTLPDIKSYDDLLDYLQNWTTWHGEEHSYDFGGMVHILGACLDNMRKYALTGEIEDIGDYLDVQRKEFLIKIAAILRQSEEPRQ